MHLYRKRGRPSTTERSPIRIGSQIRPLPHFAILTIAFLGTSACSRNRGPTTYEYLSAEHQLYSRCAMEIRSIPRPVPPELQNAAHETPREREQARKVYLAELARFYDASMKRDQSCRTIISQTQSRISLLSARGVEPEAVVLVQQYQQYLGDRVRLFEEHEAIARFALSQLQVSQQPRLLEHIIVGLGDAIVATPAAGVAAFAKGVLGDIESDSHRSAQILEHINAVQELGASAARDQSMVLTHRAVLEADYQNRYPEERWETLVEAPEASPKQQ